MPVVDKVLNVGILGCSDIACRKFLPALMKTEKAALTSVASRETEKAKAFFDKAEYESLSYEALLESEEVDLVYLSLPNHLHEEWAIRALEKGKHVLCEKPLGLSGESVEKVVRYADERGLLVYENIMYLHHPQHAMIKQLVESGKIGNIRVVRTAFGFCLVDDMNFRLDAEMGGGAFHDLARYPLSTALYYLDAETYRFKGFSLYRGGLNVGVNGCALSSANEIFDFSMSFDQQYESYYEIVGEKGKIRLDRAYTTPADHENRIHIQTGSDAEMLTVPPCDHFTLMIEHVADLILSGKGYETVHRQNRRLASLADDLKASCEDVQL